MSRVDLPVVAGRLTQRVDLPVVGNRADTKGNLPVVSALLATTGKSTLRVSHTATSLFPLYISFTLA